MYFVFKWINNNIEMINPITLNGKDIFHAVFILLDNIKHTKDANKKQIICKGIKCSIKLFILIIIFNHFRNNF